MIREKYDLLQARAECSFHGEKIGIWRIWTALRKISEKETDDKNKGVMTMGGDVVVVFQCAGSVFSAVENERAKNCAAPLQINFTDYVRQFRPEAGKSRHIVA